MRALLFALYFVVQLGTARAETAWAYVLEYWVDTSLHIGVYQFESAAAHPRTEDYMRELLHIYPGSPRSDYELLDVKVKLARTLCGTPPATLSVVCSAYTKFPESIPLKFDVKDQFLVFWWETSASEASPAYVISLTKPPASYHKPLASDSLSPAIRPDFTVLKDGKLIEQVVKERIAARPQARLLPRRSHDDSMARVEIPWETEARRAIYTGSACYLVMPKELVTVGQKVVPDEMPIRKGSPSQEMEEEEEVVLPLKASAPKTK